MSNLHRVFVGITILGAAVTLQGLIWLTGPAGAPIWEAAFSGVQTAVAIAVAWGGYVGLSTWRAQLRGTDRYEKGKAIILAIDALAREVDSAFSWRHYNIHPEAGLFAAQWREYTRRTEQDPPPEKLKNEYRTQLRSLSSKLVAIQFKNVRQKLSELRAEMRLNRVIFGAALDDDVVEFDELFTRGWREAAEIAYDAVEKREASLALAMNSSLQKKLKGRLEALEEKILKLLEG